MRQQKSNTAQISFAERRQLLFRVCRDIHHNSPRYILSVCLLGIAQAAQEFIPIWLSGRIVDCLAIGGGAQKLLSFLLIGIGLNFVLMIPEYVCGPKMNVKYNELLQKSDMMVNSKILNMDYIRIEDSEVHQEFDRIKNFATECCYCKHGHGIFYSVVDQLEGISYGIMTVICAFLLTWKLFTGRSGISGWFVILGVVILLVVQNLLRGRNILKEEQLEAAPDTVRPNRILQFFQNNYCGRYQTAKDIQLYGQKEFITQKTDELFDQWHTEKTKQDEIHTKQAVCDGIFGFVRSVFIYGYAAWRAVSGAISAGTLLQDVQSFYRLQKGVDQIMESVTYLDNCFYPLRLVYEFLDIPDEKYLGSIPTEKRDDCEYEFEFHHVFFKYPGSDDYVLRDVSLKWKIGSKMALVGKNGSGKTTLIKLLCRLYDPTLGEITLNGVDIRKYKLEDYMDLFSVVFQDSGLFSFSVAENIAASMEYDEKKVTACAERSGLAQRITEMPKGIHTCLYKDFEADGIEVSGGEAQKLELARAIYKGAPFIILDEPTAALDPIAESEIYTKFNEIVGTRTAIYISHRLSSCQFCDEILVMDHGFLVQQGTHEELISQGGVYAGMWSAQAEYYRVAGAE